MLMEKVLETAYPFLEGRTVQDMVIGISLVSAQLDNDNVGASYVLREDLKSGCSIFPYGKQVIGQDAASIAEWVVSGKDNLQKGIGMAVLTAASRSQRLEDAEANGLPFGIAVRETDTIGIVGYIAPIVKMMSSRSKRTYVFDRGISIRGGNGIVLPPEEQHNLLPTCDIVVLSGTSMINGTIDGLVKMCKNAREIMIIGASTPMFPPAFSHTGITVLAGSWWDSHHKDDIFRSISLACGISALGEYSIKKSVRV